MGMKSNRMGELRGVHRRRCIAHIGGGNGRQCKMYAQGMQLVNDNALASRKARAKRAGITMMMKGDHSRLCGGNLKDRLLSHVSSCEE